MYIGVERLKQRDLKVDEPFELSKHFHILYHHDRFTNKNNYTTSLG